MNIDLKHIAKLARLKLDEDQLPKFQSEMEKIVAMVENLPDINEELTLDAGNPMTLREDIAVSNKFRREDLMKNAPQVQAGCLVVPKTVE